MCWRGALTWVAAAALLLLYGRQWRRGGDRSRRPRAVGRRRDVLRDRLVTLDAGGASAEWRVVTQRRRGRRRLGRFCNT